MCHFCYLYRGMNEEFWNDSGCQTVEFENGSVSCQCNHLTHFAIILSPGVEVRITVIITTTVLLLEILIIILSLIWTLQVPSKHQFVLTVVGQVFVSISLLFLLITIIMLVSMK